MCRFHAHWERGVALAMFVQSSQGISHDKVEDTQDDHLEMATTASDKLADKTMQWSAA